MNVATITRHDLVIFNIYKQTSTTLIVCNIIELLCIFYSKKKKNLGTTRVVAPFNASIAYYIINTLLAAF